MKSWNEFYRDNGGTPENGNELYARFCNPNDPGHSSTAPGNSNLPAVSAFIEKARSKFKRPG